MFDIKVFIFSANIKRFKCYVKSTWSGRAFSCDLVTGVFRQSFNQKYFDKIIDDASEVISVLIFVFTNFMQKSPWCLKTGVLYCGVCDGCRHGPEP